jgi:transposase
MKRKKYSKELKSKVAIAAIKGHKTANEIASEFGIHPSMVNKWKKQAIESIPDIFANRREKDAKEIEAEKDILYRQIGKLQVELEWLKKTTGHLL